VNAGVNKGAPLLMISELFLPTKGGTAVWFDEVYRRLGGKEIHIVTAEVPGSADHDAGHPNSVHRLRLRRYRWVRPESLVMYWKLFVRSWTLTVRHRFVSVHAGRVLPEGLIAWLVARVMRLKVVIYAHGEEITTWRQSRKFRAMVFVYKHADQIIANSEFTQRELLKLGVAPERVTIISPGVDTQRFRPGLPAEKLRERLGLSNEQKLILLAEGVDTHYAIIGIGPDYDRLSNLAQELGVAARVHFLGPVSMAELPRWYNGADVFAMPNRNITGDTEGFGMVFLEAAACRTPVLAGLAGGTGTAVLDGITGIRVDGSQVTAVVGGLRSLLIDIQLSNRMARAAYARATSEFSWDAVAEKTASLESALRRTPIVADNAATGGQGDSIGNGRRNQQ
jgi:phosphatidylinositol alpha-1,6-mannosyltransferase